MDVAVHIHLSQFCLFAVFLDDPDLLKHFVELFFVRHQTSFLHRDVAVP